MASFLFFVAEKQEALQLALTETNIDFSFFKCYN